jgi:hypothetical protein
MQRFCPSFAGKEDKEASHKRGQVGTLPVVSILHARQAFRHLQYLSSLRLTTTAQVSAPPLCPLSLRTQRLLASASDTRSREHAGRISKQSVVWSQVEDAARMPGNTARSAACSSHAVATGSSRPIQGGCLLSGSPCVVKDVSCACASQQPAAQWHPVPADSGHLDISITKMLPMNRWPDTKLHYYYHAIGVAPYAPVLPPAAPHMPPCISGGWVFGIGGPAPPRSPVAGGAAPSACAAHACMAACKVSWPSASAAQDSTML